MPDGGLFAMAAPPDPYPCPPAYFKQYKPRSKITVLDAKDTFAGQDLFQDAYCGLHRGTVHCECLGLETIELSP
jgi:sulfide dehydrogenase [flavocytochrome c] flavoprotein subunit